MSWSYEETFKFIDLYKKEPVIWNPKNDFYRDKCKAQEAWSRLEYEMQIPVSELKKKKETLMTLYRLYNKKIIVSIRLKEDEVYKPIWAFYDRLESFLKEVYEIPNEDSDGFASTSLQFNDEEQDISKKSRSTKKKDLKTAHVVKRYSNVKQVNKKMSYAYNNLSQVLKSCKRSNNSSNRKGDDCDWYGRLIAKRLRQFSETERQEIMYELDGFLLTKCPGTTEIAGNTDSSDS